MVDPSTVLSAAPGVLAAFVGGETILWSEPRGTYYGLDDVGTRVWQLSGDGRTLGEIHGRLLDEYEVDSSILDGDLKILAGELIALGLVIPSTNALGADHVGDVK